MDKGTELTGKIGHINKDLEKEYLEDLDHYDEGMGIHSTSYRQCKERLIRLAKIDNAKPSEALECLEERYDFLIADNDTTYSNSYENETEYNRRKETIYKQYNTIKQALIKAQEQEKEIDRLDDQCLDVLGDNIRLKKILDIIKEKNVDIHWIKKCKTLNEYNNMLNSLELAITQEEFDNLKEVLKCQD